MTEPAIELHGMTKRFGQRTAVDNVSFTVPRGSVYGLVGPNGAGKTTLMRSLLGFTRPTAGHATVLGERMPGSESSIYPRIGVIIEEPRFFPFLTGRENLEQVVAARAGNIGRAQVDAALARVELADRAGERVKAYSLGMRQRLGIARAILHDPELLVLDEPSNGLDPPGIRDMRLLLRGLADEGRTVLVSSHLLAEVELMCDHVAVLKEGGLIANGPVGDVAIGGQEGAPASVRVLVGVSDAPAAQVVLAGLEGAPDTAPGVEAGTLLVTVGEAERDAARINRALVEAGLEVHLLTRVTQTLEERFLEIVGDTEGAPHGS